MSTTTDITALRVRSTPSLYDGIKNLGALANRLDELTLAEAKEVQRIKAKRAEEIAQLGQAIDQQISSVKDYVVINRDYLLGGEKTVVTEAGQIAIHALPAKIEYENEKALLKLFVAEGRKNLLKRSVSIDKTAVKKQRPEIEGIRYLDEREKLIITPITSGDDVIVEL